MLLSFAQFEREVIGDKRKCLWVGGPVPLGYRCIDKKLEIVPQEAEVVRTIFTRYLELGSMGTLLGSSILPRLRLNATAYDLTAAAGSYKAVEQRPGGASHVHGHEAH
jgi:hypothetical protein